MYTCICLFNNNNNNKDKETSVFLTDDVRISAFFYLEFVNSDLAGGRSVQWRHCHLTRGLELEHSYERNLLCCSTVQDTETRNIIFSSFFTFPSNVKRVCSKLFELDKTLQINLSSLGYNLRTFYVRQPVTSPSLFNFFFFISIWLFTDISWILTHTVLFLFYVTLAMGTCVLV